jgi:hypothetical protein
MSVTTTLGTLAPARTRAGAGRRRGVPGQGIVLGAVLSVGMWWGLAAFLAG